MVAVRCLRGVVGRTIWRVFVCSLISGVPVAMAAEMVGSAACGDEQLRFINSDIFDTSLESRVINSCPNIEILTASKMTLDEISPRLDRWLVRVVNGGGKVTVRKDAEKEVSRAVPLTVLSALAGVAWDTYVSYRSTKRERVLAAAAAGYDATIYEDEASFVITAVVLSRRER